MVPCLCPAFAIRARTYALSGAAVALSITCSSVDTLSSAVYHDVGWVASQTLRRPRFDRVGAGTAVGTSGGRGICSESPCFAAGVVNICSSEMSEHIAASYAWCVASVVRGKRMCSDTSEVLKPCPTHQFVQAVAPVALDVPGSQFKHSYENVSGWYVPATQSSHAALPSVSAKVPASQS